MRPITSYSCTKERQRPEERKVGIVIPYPSSMSRFTEEQGQGMMCVWLALELLEADYILFLHKGKIETRREKGGCCYTIS